MSRLQKQCIFASTGLHALLLVLLIFGAGFLPKEPEQRDLKPFHMMPTSVIESLLDDPADIQGEAQPEPEPEIEDVQPEPKPEPVKPEPKPEPVRPEPVKPEPKPEPKPEVKVTEPKPKPKPKSKLAKPEDIKINTKFKKNNTPKPRTTQPRPIKTPKSNAPKISIDPKLGKVGKGSQIKAVTTVTGSKYGQYGITVKDTYDRRWIQPANNAGSNLSVRIRVVVNINGTIASAKIIRSSGNPAMDRSIELVLQRVKSIPTPPPPGLSLADRTFTITFKIE